MDNDNDEDNINDSQTLLKKLHEYYFFHSKLNNFDSFQAFHK